MNTTLVHLAETASLYDAGGRLTSQVSCAAGSTVCDTTHNAYRHTDLVYDYLARKTVGGRLARTLQL